MGTIDQDNEHIAELWQIVQAQSRQSAFAALFRILQPHVSKKVFQLIRDEAIVDEIVDDIFVDIWNRRSDLTIKTNLRSYLLKAATFKAYDQLRKQYRTPDQTSLDKTSFQISENAPSAQQTLEVQELHQKIVDTMEKLPPKCRLVFELSRFQNQSYQEIAALLEISMKTVENHMTKALKIMRSRIFSE